MPAAQHLKFAHPKDSGIICDMSIPPVFPVSLIHELELGYSRVPA